jgi:DNA-binding transcriptional ArsR family regulator
MEDRDSAVGTSGGEDAAGSRPTSVGSEDGFDSGLRPSAPSGGDEMEWTAQKWTAVRSPIRMELLSLIEAEQVCTISDLSRMTGRRPQTLYRHMQMLVDAELVIIVGTRPSKRRPEHLYRVSRSLERFREVVSSDDVAAENFVELTEATLRAIGRGFRQYFEHRMRTPVGERQPARYMARHEVTWIDQARAERLNELGRQLSAIVDEGRSEKTGIFVQIDLMAWPRSAQLVNDEADHDEADHDQTDHDET